MEEKILQPFGPSEIVVCDNAACFTAGFVKSLMDEWETQWKTVQAYDPKSNKRVERMVGTVKKAIARLVVKGGDGWRAAVLKVVFGYCRRQTQEDPSQFQLLYGVKPRILMQGYKTVAPVVDESLRQVEAFAVAAMRAMETDIQAMKARQNAGVDTLFHEKDLVVVVFGKYFTAAKWPALKPRAYGPAKIVEARHPRYQLVLSTENRTHKGIHARLLILYHPRQ